ncbi:hypothetical protein MTO96_039220 [Rhipicephalus appendiculatus]
MSLQELLEDMVQFQDQCLDKLLHIQIMMLLGLRWLSALAPKRQLPQILQSLMQAPHQHQLSDVAAIGKRWRNLRDTFCKKLCKAKKRTGAPAGEPVSSWKHFTHMMFLRDIVEPRVTSSNMDIAEDDSVSEILGNERDSLFETRRKMLLDMVDDTQTSPNTNTTPSSQSSALTQNTSAFSNVTRSTKRKKKTTQTQS